jgi:molecular chaperone DnaK (HSP70)
VGARFDDPRIERWRRFWPFEIEPDGNAITIVVSQGEDSHRYRPERLLVALLADFIRRLEEGFRRKACGVVLPIPAWSPRPDPDPQAPIVARRTWKSFPIFVIDEVRAAALGYSVQQAEQGFLATRQTVLLVDFGAGQLEVGLFSLKAGSDPILIDRWRDDSIGGRELDFRLAEACLARVGVDLEKLDRPVRAELISLLVKRCCTAKEALSTEPDCEINLNFKNPPIKHEKWKVTQAEFEELCEPCFGQMDEVLDKVQRRIDDVLLLGGTCRIPAVRERILKRFERGPDERQHDLLIVRGAILSARRHKIGSI